MNSPKFSQDPDQTYGSSQGRSSVAQTARDAAAKVGSVATETASRVKQRAEDMISQGKDSAADRVGSYSSAIHDTARSLEQQDPNIAWLTHQAAERLERVATYMRSRDFQGLRSDAENLARRHPAAFFGGMCVAGLVLGSVIRATRSAAQDSHTKSQESDYPSYMNETREPSASYAETSATGPVAGEEI